MDIVIINVPTSAAGHTVQYLLVISPLPRLSVLLLDPCLLCPPHSPLFCGPFAVAHTLAYTSPHFLRRALLRFSATYLLVVCGGHLFVVALGIDERERAPTPPPYRACFFFTCFFFLFFLRFAVEWRVSWQSRITYVIALIFGFGLLLRGALLLPLLSHSF